MLGVLFFQGVMSLGVLLRFQGVLIDFKFSSMVYYTLKDFKCPCFVLLDFKVSCHVHTLRFLTWCTLRFQGVILHLHLIDFKVCVSNMLDVLFRFQGVSCHS
ncbi:hypothetical protein CEXT_600201 [Caerostris extrusa]|uniref:Uncharacterized protein n=1 Tax=Caerostris extrusa TaxID=172846 RepID=A0AAV4S7X4_CAEEX|nr:hypothetical protein CEXT_600201 [Caerostris extrusa]